MNIGKIADGPIYGGATDSLYIKDNKLFNYKEIIDPITFASNPQFSGLEAVRYVKRRCIAHVKELAGPWPIVRFYKISLTRDKSEYGNPLPYIHVFVQTISTEVDLDARP